MGITDDPAENGGPYPRSLWGAGGIDHGGAQTDGKRRWKKQRDNSSHTSAIPLWEEECLCRWTYLTDAVGKGFCLVDPDDAGKVPTGGGHQVLPN